MIVVNPKCMTEFWMWPRRVLKAAFIFSPSLLWTWYSFGKDGGPAKQLQTWTDERRSIITSNSNVVQVMEINTLLQRVVILIDKDIFCTRAKRNDSRCSAFKSPLHVEHFHILPVPAYVTAIFFSFPLKVVKKETPVVSVSYILPFCNQVRCLRISSDFYTYNSVNRMQRKCLL